MKKQTIFMIVLTCIYAIHLYYKFNHLPEYQWISAYLADLLCLPVLLFLLKNSIQIYHKNKTFEINDTQIVFLFVYVSLVFEILLPYFSSRYTSDFYDVLAYGFGAVIYKVTT